jgi:hypothetical protein
MATDRSPYVTDGTNPAWCFSSSSRNMEDRGGGSKYPRRVVTFASQMYTNLCVCDSTTSAPKRRDTIRAKWPWSVNTECCRIASAARHRPTTCHAASPPAPPTISAPGEQSLDRDVRVQRRPMEAEGTDLERLPLRRRGAQQA